MCAFVQKEQGYLHTSSFSLALFVISPQSQYSCHTKAPTFFLGGVTRVVWLKLPTTLYLYLQQVLACASDCNKFKSLIVQLQIYWDTRHHFAIKLSSK